MLPLETLLFIARSKIHISPPRWTFHPPDWSDSLNYCVWYKTEKSLWSKPFTPSLHDQISQGKKRDLNTDDLCLTGILCRSSCFFPFLRTNTKPLLCYFILSVKEIWCFLLVKYFVQCKHKKHQPPQKKYSSNSKTEKHCHLGFMKWNFDENQMVSWDLELLQNLTFSALSPVYNYIYTCLGV